MEAIIEVGEVDQREAGVLLVAVDGGVGDPLGGSYGRGWSPEIEERKGAQFRL